MQIAPRLRKTLFTAAKLLLTAAALWFVFAKIDFQSLLAQLRTAHPLWLLLAAVFFIFSKALSSLRLNTYFRCTGLVLEEKINLRLYALGMYYNLFLPGGIGGDGYKIYLLNKHYEVPGKKLFQAVLLDRLSGLAAICSLCFLLLLFVDAPFGVKAAAIAGALLVFLVYKFMIRRFFPIFRANLAVSNWYSLAVQLAQTFCVLLIMLSLGIREEYQAYLLIFFISSVAAVLPVTIGGVGAREVVFLFGARYFGLDAHQAVAISLLFFGITALTSLCGIYFSFNTQQLLRK
ncbi:hypothetical protein EDD80_101506 [Anseongella ginsenosidimutans]|uniref:Lysylphosphatidylglycerol synthase-like protein n=1 Tax=Anseongella ginsenosidimutans TaxID=496056 RepID=A0A4R3KZ23_9SPHI|nr:lysylphosphatidylglycerol synthase transmembrane domain-containing protein [Anseongella ginsenosidimutans]QEC51038.1 flippase-like domain-containing protein [Anseongella ginsenosidimutans]TCS90306.1 hypothetical protein EDD80_101506 [Anseongella ginsenosidimutans]